MNRLILFSLDAMTGEDLDLLLTLPNAARLAAGRLSAGTSLRTRPEASKVAVSPIRNVTTRPPRSPCNGESGPHAGERMEYTNGNAGPWVKKKSRYGSFPSRTSCAA